MQKSILIIWEENPEDIKLYLIPEKDAVKHMDYLDQAHDCMINHSRMNDGLRFLNFALNDFDEDDLIYDEELRNEADKFFNALEVKAPAITNFSEYKGIWKKFKVKSGNPITDVNITKVYKSGIML